MTKQHKQHDYRPDIDGLRAISILSVLVYHAFPSLLPGGFVGVDIFFVISGYLINGIILQGLQSGHFSYLVFYSRRIKRIFPALSLILVACLICGWLFLFPREWRELGKHVFGGAAFISNLLLLREGGYFDATSASKPLLHLWSLGIEEQFYITWPLLLALVWKWKRASLVSPLIVASICISFLANVIYIGGHQNAVFYFPLTRYWEILIGAFLATRAHFHRFEPSGGFLPPLFTRVLPPKILSLAGVALLFCALATARDDGRFPGYLALLPTCAAACLITAGPDAWFNRVVLSRPYMVLIGLISYPLYLWHWPILVFGRLIAGQPIGWLARVIALLISLVFSFWTYKFWEIPIRNYRSVASVVTFLAFLVGVAGTAGLLVNRRAIAARLSNSANQRILAASDDWSYPFGDNFKRDKNYQVGIVKGRAFALLCSAGIGRRMWGISLVPGGRDLLRAWFTGLVTRTVIL